MIDEKLRAEMEKAVRDTHTVQEAFARGEHVWLATVSYRVDPLTVDEFGVRAKLTSENRFGPVAVGCLICEKHWTPDLHGSPCAGDPSGIL